MTLLLLFKTGILLFLYFRLLQQSLIGDVKCLLD